MKSKIQNPKSKIQNAFTDAPDLHPNLILGSLHLLFWLFFHPSAWRNYIARLDSLLRSDFTLVELNRTQWRIPALRRLLIQGYVVLPLFVGLSVAMTLWAKGASFEALVVPVFFVLSINLTLAVMIGAVISVAAGMVSGVAVSIAVGIVSSATSGTVSSIAVPTAVSIAIGAAGGIAGAIAKPRLTFSSTRLTGGVIIGILVGVLAVSAVRFGLTTLANMVIVQPGDMGYNLSRIIVVGASFGVAIGWRRGITVGVIGGLLTSLAYGTTIIAWKNGWTGPAIGLTSGILFGTSFGVTVVLPYVLADWIAGPWAGAWAGALGSWGRHIFRNNIPLWPALPLGLIGVSVGITLILWKSIALYPLLAAWNLILYRLDQRRAGNRPNILRWHSAFWDEHQRWPLRGLDDHLLLVMDCDPQHGQAALEYLRASRQRWAVQAVQVELEARRLEQGKEITSIGNIHHSLASGDLTSSANMLLRNFSHVSQDVEAALNQTTAYHQRLALGTVDDRLSSLARELTVSNDPLAGRFYPIAASWHQIVVDHLQKLAEAVEQSQEIDNPYIVGVPLTEQQEIFVGRTDIVARIEQLLLDRRHPPLLLYGQRRMGKTSLLRNLGRLLPRNIVPLFVDGQRVALATDYPDFLYNIGREMCKSAEQQRGLDLPPLSREILAANPFTCFNEWLDDVERTLDTQGYTIALLALDEFEVLDSVLNKGRFDETDVLSMLRHIIQHRPHFKVMLTGSHTFEEFQRWAGYLINVQVVKIGYLEKSEVHQLIECPIKDFALRYEADAGQRVQELTQGHPALVQLLCYEIVTLKNEQDATMRRLAQLADIETAVERALDSGSFFFTDIQQNQINDTGLALLRFMAIQGEGVVVNRDALLAHYSQHSDELNQTLKLLMQRDLIEAVEGGYRFQVELIRRWFAQTF